MTDPLDDLKQAFDRATPEPDGEKRKATLARAMEAFDEAQESVVEPRRTHDLLTTWAGIGRGVRHMFKALGLRPALIVTAGLAAVGLAVFLAIVSRNAASGPPIVVADAVAASEQEAALREADSVELPSDPVPSQGSTDGRTAQEEQPLDSQSPRSEAPPPPGAEARSVAVHPSAAQAAISGAVRITADGPMVERSDVTASRLAESPPTPPPAQPTAPIFVAEEALVARGFVESAKRLRRSLSASPGDPALSVASAAIPADLPAHRPANTEAFANEPASPVKIASEQPVSTFSIDVDTASYSVVRSSLMNGYLPTAESVRIEEMVNYFPYAYPAPAAGGAPFKPTVSVSPTPWNPDTLLMHIGIQGRLPATDERPPLNLVFLIDTSGSMRHANKLPLLKQSFRLMLGQLRSEDEVAIVTYAGSAGRVLDATPATERAKILAALDGLHAQGSTAGAAGIQSAYRTAAGMTAEGEVTRVILATDGDFNVGIADPEELKGLIARQRDGGIYLSILGFGRGNLDDATMQSLAQNGNGHAAYIDTLAEARKVLVDQLTGTLFPIADDVKIQVEFNPATVAEYRLIGYETRALRREDFNNDRVDAGEIGAGHSVTAIYEVTPAGSPAVLHDALRYEAPAADPPATARGATGFNELAFLRLRYKEPGEDTSHLVELPVARGTGDATSDTRFAAAIAGFGQLLTRGAYTGDWSYADAIALAEANTGNDRFGYRREAVTLMRLAESLSE